MIINLRGTSGSGKTTIMKQLMAQCGLRIRVRERGKKRIIGYLCPHPVPGEQPLAIPGSYEIATGGCDTLPNMDTIFFLVREGHQRGFHVVYEGLLISADQKRTHELHAAGLPIEVICLEVPIDVCVESVNMRRRAKRGEDAEPVNPRNTESKWHQTKKAARWLGERGVPVTWCNREQALTKILDLLKMEKRDVPEVLVQGEGREAARPSPRQRHSDPSPVEAPRAPDLSAR